MTDASSVVLDARTPYAPRILRMNDQLIFEVYVASGHADRVERLPITEAHARVLCTDVDRYWFLFAALHHPYQLAATRLRQNQLDHYLDTILFGPPMAVERFLSDLDHGAANGALSNLLRIFLDADPTRLRAGHWFAAMPRPE